MPFESEKQRRFLEMRRPDVAKKFKKHNGKSVKSSGKEVFGGAVGRRLKKTSPSMGAKFKSEAMASGRTIGMPASRRAGSPPVSPRLKNAIHRRMSRRSMPMGGSKQ